MEKLKKRVNEVRRLLEKATWEEAPHIHPQDCICGAHPSQTKHHWTCVDKNAKSTTPIKPNDEKSSASDPHVYSPVSGTISSIQPSSTNHSIIVDADDGSQRTILIPRHRKLLHRPGDYVNTREIMHELTPKEHEEASAAVAHIIGPGPHQRPLGYTPDYDKGRVAKSYDPRQETSGFEDPEELAERKGKKSSATDSTQLATMTSTLPTGPKVKKLKTRIKKNKPQEGTMEKLVKHTNGQWELLEKAKAPSFQPGSKIRINKGVTGRGYEVHETTEGGDTVVHPNVGFGHLDKMVEAGGHKDRLLRMHDSKRPNMYLHHEAEVKRREGKNYSKSGGHTKYTVQTLHPIGEHHSVSTGKLEKSDEHLYFGEPLKKAEVLEKPPVSEAQRKAMWAAAKGNSQLGIPQSVGKEFAEKDPGGKLPKKVSKEELKLSENGQWDIKEIKKEDMEKQSDGFVVAQPSTPVLGPN